MFQSCSFTDSHRSLHVERLSSYPRKLFVSSHDFGLEISPCSSTSNELTRKEIESRIKSSNWRKKNYKRGKWSRKIRETKEEKERRSLARDWSNARSRESSLFFSACVHGVEWWKIRGKNWKWSVSCDMSMLLTLYYYYFFFASIWRLSRMCVASFSLIRW
jgi:hypothetical protein